jgi:hypothetical protein
VVTVFAHISLVSTGLLVPSAAKSPTAIFGGRPFPGKEHNTDGGVLLGIVERLIQLAGGPGAERIANLGAIKGDSGHAICFLVGDILKFTYRLPRDAAHKA